MCGREWGGGGCLFEARRLLTFSAFYNGRLFEVGANLKLGAHSNKYDTCECSLAIHAGEGCLISQGEQKLTSIPEDVVWVRSTPQQASSHKNDVRVVQQPVTRSMIIFPDIITILKYHSIS